MVQKAFVQLSVPPHQSEADISQSDYYLAFSPTSESAISLAVSIWVMNRIHLRTGVKLVPKKVTVNIILEMAYVHTHTWLRMRSKTVVEMKQFHDLASSKVTEAQTNAVGMREWYCHLSSTGIQHDLAVLIFRNSKFGLFLGTCECLIKQTLDFCPM